MSEMPSRSVALKDISAWDMEEVLCLLRKNGLEECCKAVAKRQIDGDDLLHLTDGKLALWKSDLTRPLIGKLWVFVQKLNKTPEKYLLDKSIGQQNDGHLSDSGSWGTDFEDEASDESSHFEETKDVIKPSSIRNKQTLSQNSKDANGISTRLPKRIAKMESEETYANCESCQDEENTYANFQKTKLSPTRNASRLHGRIEKSSIEKLKEESKWVNDLSIKKPTIAPKPEIVPSRETRTTFEGKFPRKSFLHNAPSIKQRVSNEIQKRMIIPPSSEPTRNTSVIEKELPKPPATIRTLDLVANLPARTEGSEDEYETFDENIIEQNQKKKILRVDSKQSLNSNRQESVESLYEPASSTNHEEEEDYEVYYESVIEAPEENDYYLKPIQRTNDPQAPPPLPAKSSSISPSSTLPTVIRSQKATERSPDKRSVTLPHVSNNTSLSAERATRPLPPPPERQSYVDKPWFHNVTREQAAILIKEQGIYNNPQDGHFLLRPSTTHVGNPLALVLWYKDRIYNVPVRKRNDNRYALGSAKMNEKSFSSVEEIVSFHMREELVLHTGGMQAGSTKLTDTPPK